MKNLQISLVSIILLSVCFVGMAQKTPLTNGYSITPLPHTFNGDSKDIDVDGDTNPDFAVECYGSAPFNYRIYGVNPGNKVFVEYDGLPLDAQEGKKALTTTGATYVSILAYKTLIEAPIDQIPNSPSETLEGSINIDPFWSMGGIILGDVLHGSPGLQATTQTGATNGYIGVYYYSSGSYYTGWLHYQYVSPGVFNLLSAGSGSAPQASVPAGLNDPYGPATVPIPLVASIFGMLAIGGGIFFRRKRNK